MAVDGSDEIALARDFLSFLTTDEAQSTLPTTNWMYPAKTPESGLPEGFETLIAPDQALLAPIEDTPAIIDTALDEWRSALSR